MVENNVFNIVIISWIIIGIIVLIPLQFKDEIKPENDFIFKCNPHYFGAKFSYLNECPNSYINVTGNYCNGILVCENKLRYATYE